MTSEPTTHPTTEPTIDGRAGFAVICVDGQVRHEGLFTTRREADDFAEWGHCCVRSHDLLWLGGVA